MDATKAAASTTLNQNTTTSDEDPRNKYKEQIKQTYKGVPDSLEAQSLLSEFKQLSQYLTQRPVCCPLANLFAFLHQKFYFHRGLISSNIK